MSTINTAQPETGTDKPQSGFQQQISYRELAVTRRSRLVFSISFNDTAGGQPDCVVVGCAEVTKKTRPERGAVTRNRREKSSADGAD